MIKSTELEDWNSLKYKMKEEVFHYCFDGYSNWEHINDEEFHKLRLAYLESAKNLETYILYKTKKLNENS